MIDGDEEYKEVLNKIRAILKSLGIDIDEVEPCLIYQKYLIHKLAYIEKLIYELQEKIIYIEKLNEKKIKEIHK